MNTIAGWRRPFFSIYAGQAFSLLSSSAVQFAIIWWITVETGSALSLTVASIVGLLPQAMIGLFAGAWIDRFDRRRIIIAADALVAASSLLLSVLFMLGFRFLGIVYVILFARSLGETFHKPALQALIPCIVPSEELSKAGGFGQMINTACSMLGPMLGAFLMSAADLEWIMLLDVLGASMAIATLSAVKLPNMTRKLETGTSILREIKQGLTAFRSNKALLGLSIPMLISTIVFIPLGTLLPLMVRSYFSGTAWHNGLVQTVFSSGMLFSAMIIALTGGMRRQLLMLSLFTGLLGFCSLIAGLVPAGLFWLFCVLVFLMGTTGSGFNIPFFAYVQRTVPSENLGKVLSLISSVMSFAAPVGMFIAGPVAEAVGVSNWMVIAGVLMVLNGAASYGITRKHDVVSHEAMVKMHSRN